MTQETSKASLPFGWAMLIFSAIYPACVIGIEFFTGMCAESFFDPIPTVFHLLLVSFVPAVNFALWLKLRSHIAVSDRYLLLAAASTMTIAAYYTVIFLPILPVAAIGIVFMGLGLLPFAPLVSFICAIKLYRRLKQAGEEGTKQNSYIWKGVLVSLFVLTLLDLPSAATYYGVNLASSKDTEEHIRGIKLLRTLGDEDLLLRLSYDGNRRATGLISFVALMSNKNNRITPLKARQIYYRVTGKPFNHRPPPYDGQAWSRFGTFRFDNDLGGTEVGGRVEGLELISSRLDGSVSSEDSVAYMEWIMEFENASPFQQEARIQLALPPGGVVSRASLWVEGEEREAAFAGRTKARQAYQSVVRTRRDPLLVTTVGTDRIMAQAFPIQAHGGKIKFKIGITAPLELGSSNENLLVMPSIVDRNFSFTAQFKHALWFESHRPMQLNIAELKNENVGSHLHRLNGSVSDTSLSSSRKVLRIPKDSKDLRRIATFNNDQMILQELAEFKTVFNGALLILVDGSESVRHHREAIISALNDIPEGKKVGILFASEDFSDVKIYDWSNDKKQVLAEQLLTHKFIGGQDNAPALEAGIRSLETYKKAELLWIHGPQPVLFESTSTLLSQALDRLVKLPKITLYSVKPGPNKLLAMPYIELNSRILPNTGDEKHDLSRYLQDLYSNKSRYKIHRSLVDNSSLEVNGSEHIRRLWARDKVFELIKNGETNEAIRLATSNQLVTPVSGAVVLENQQQYEQNDLTPVEKNSVPTIPEPRQWILAFITLVFFIWFFRHNKLNLTRPI